ncbi:hypothetical protein [Cohaesibacter marisflavi]|uniref:hypothetical protein n=1 Tax=Cohaesibacter marisflavi TaxID=655353 RepID=UPI0029C87B46|nr:hypothetical protein [Cohaesibacter marisflavi]
MALKGVPAVKNKEGLDHSRRFELSRAIDSRLVQDAIDHLYADYLERRQGRKPNQRDIPRIRCYLEKLYAELVVATQEDHELYLGYNRAAAYFKRGGEYWNLLNDKPLLSRRLFLELPLEL